MPVLGHYYLQQLNGPVALTEMVDANRLWIASTRLNKVFSVLVFLFIAEIEQMCTIGFRQKSNYIK